MARYDCCAMNKTAVLIILVLTYDADVCNSVDTAVTDEHMEKRKKTR